MDKLQEEINTQGILRHDVRVRVELTEPQTGDIVNNASLARLKKVSRKDRSRTNALNDLDDIQIGE